MSDKQMYLHAATDNCNSECSVELDYTEAEWEKLSEEERNDAINEMKANILDIWVEAK